MEYRVLKISLGFIFVASLASLGAIVVFIDPLQTTTISFLLFSAVLFLALFSLLGWLGMKLRKRFISENNYHKIVTLAVRQAILFSAILISYLWLNHFKILKWWSGILVLLLMLGLEYYFLTASGKTEKDSD